MVLSLQPAGDYLIQSRHSVFLFKKISKNSSCMPGYCRSLWRRSCLRECPSGSCSFSRALFSALQIPGWTQHWLTLHLYYLYVWVYVCVHECVCVLVTVCTSVQASVLLLGHFSVLKLTCPRQEMWRNLSLSPHAVYTGRLNNFVTSLFIYHHVRAIILFQATY